MSRAAKLVLLSLVVAGMPVGAAGAAAACTVLPDAVGDTFGPVVGTPGAAEGTRFDLVGVRVALSGSDMHAEIALADLAGARDPGGTVDAYQASWRLGTDVYLVTASLSDYGWRFFARVDRSDGQRQILPGAGTPDNAASVVRVAVPVATAGAHIPWDLSARAMERLSIEHESALLKAHINTAADGIRTDAAPDAGREEEEGTACAPVLPLWTEPSVVCDVATDRSGDVTSSGGSDSDPALDLLALRVGANDTVVAVDLRVADLSVAPPDYPDAHHYVVSWQTQSAGGGTETFYASALRQDGYEDFRFTAHGASGDAAGRFDLAEGTVRMLLPRSALGFGDGTRLSAIRARTYRNKGLIVYDVGDEAPDGYPTTSATFVVGATCDTEETLQCPVVIDAADDGGFVGVNGQYLPPTEPSLDLLAVGAESDASLIRLSVKVVDPSATGPAWAERSGWLISWYAGGGKRWVGQALRLRDGELQFTYRQGDGSEAEPTLYAGEGTPTTGSVDPVTGIVRVDVPRAAVGDPADGIVLPSLGAASFASANVEPLFGWHEVADSTAVRPYRLGSACGAGIAAPD